MLHRDDRLRVRSEEIASKEMDGEAIIINLATGVYYSLEGVGALVWELVGAAWSLEEIAQAVTARFEVDLVVARRDVERLAGELVAEELVTAGAEANDRWPVAAEPAGRKGAYAAPRLTVYRDMADLLALDPPLPGLTDIPWEGSQGGERPADRQL